MSVFRYFSTYNTNIRQCQTQTKPVLLEGKRTERKKNKTKVISSVGYFFVSALFYHNHKSCRCMKSTGNVKQWKREQQSFDLSFLLHFSLFRLIKFMLIFYSFMFTDDPFHTDCFFFSNKNKIGTLLRSKKKDQWNWIKFRN